jgi:hypothetical protein
MFWGVAKLLSTFKQDVCVGALAMPATDILNARKSFSF